MKDFQDLLSPDNITFVIAILGFVLSVYNFVHERSQNRMKLHVVYKNHSISEIRGRENELTISLAFENLVEKPISISRIFLNINSKTYEFYWVPQFVYLADCKSGDTKLDEIKIHTVDIPFEINGYGVVGGFFFVSTDKKLNDKQLHESTTSITLFSNKGKRTYPISFDNPRVEI